MPNNKYSSKKRSQQPRRNKTNKTANIQRMADFQEYQLAQQCRPKIIQDSASMLIEMSDQHFERFMQEFEQNGLFHFFCAALSIWLPFQSLNRQLQQLHSRIVDAETFEVPSNGDNEAKYHSIRKEIDSINSLKQVLESFNQQLFNYEFAYCNGGFFKSDDYLNEYGKKHQQKPIRFTDKKIDLYSKMAKAVCEKYNDDTYLARFIPRITRVAKSAQAIFCSLESAKFVAESYMDVVCSYINQLLDLQDKQPHRYDQIKRAPFLIDTNQSYKIKLGAVAPLLLPSEQSIFELYNNSLSTSKNTCPQKILGFYYRFVGSVLIGTLMDQSINEDYIKKMDGVDMNMDKRAIYSPRQLFDRLDSCDKYWRKQLDNTMTQLRNKISTVLNHCCDIIINYPSTRRYLLSNNSALDSYGPTTDQSYLTFSKLSQEAQSIAHAHRVIQTASQTNNQANSSYIQRNLSLFDQAYHKSHQILWQASQGTLPYDDCWTDNNASYRDSVSPSKN